MPRKSKITPQCSPIERFWMLPPAQQQTMKDRYAPTLPFDKLDRSRAISYEMRPGGIEVEALDDLIAEIRMLRTNTEFEVLIWSEHESCQILGKSWLWRSTDPHQLVEVEFEDGDAIGLGHVLNEKYRQVESEVVG